MVEEIDDNWEKSVIMVDEIDENWEKSMRGNANHLKTEGISCLQKPGSTLKEKSNGNHQFWDHLMLNFIN